MKIHLKYVVIIMLVFFVTAASSGAGEIIFPKPSPEDKCPVCGMSVAVHQDFIAAVTFMDGKTFFFDGTRDMFKFLFGVGKYAAGRKSADITAVSVTEYYSLTPADGYKAYYVIGSDVYGPMGNELIPFAKESDAKEFLQDHKGKAVLIFKDVTPAVVKSLD